MPDFTWEKLTPAEFEGVIAALVRAMGFTNVVVHSGSGDQGVDVAAKYRSSPDGVDSPSRRWVFQCKRKKRLSRDEIHSELARFTRQDLDTWVLATSTVPTPAFRRWMDKKCLSPDYFFQRLVWWRDEINAFASEHRSELVREIAPEVATCLGLSVSRVAGPNPGFDQVTAVCRHFTTGQVDRFARSKYIPGLYVDRDVQTELLSFHAPEAELARIHRTRFAEAARRMMEGAEGALCDPDSAPGTTVSQSTDDPGKASRRTEKGEGKLLVAQERRRLRVMLYNRSRTAIEGIHRNIKQIYSDLQNLPQSLPGIEQVQSIRDKTAQVLADIDALPSEQFTKKDAERLGIPEAHLPVSERSGGALWREPLGDLVTALRDVSSALDRSLKPSFVLIDKAGGGKTNLLCHVALLLAKRTPTILLFGKEGLGDSHSLREMLISILRPAFGTEVDDLMESLDNALAARGDFLHVLVDGINEARDIARLNTSIADLLRWSRGHRVRVTISCRDIYWPFFDSELWGADVCVTAHNRLGSFSDEEYERALPLYLCHFGIECEFSGHAREITQHPLLLRFFCEAYGTANGSVCRLGKIEDIRLKQLFDEYVEKKTAHIRKMLLHHNSHEVSRFIFSLARHLFVEARSALSTTEVAMVTEHPDISTESSLYLRFLDEDIIIEEQPTDSVAARTVTFVYEEFMEYLVARALIEDSAPLAAGDIQGLFGMLSEKAKAWPNAIGVGEYVALMLLDGDHGCQYDQGITYLRCMCQAGKEWADAFWAVIGKCLERHLEPRLYTLFPLALAVSRKFSAQRAVNSMCTYSASGAGTLAGIILWSAALPLVFDWVDLAHLPSMTDQELSKLAGKLVENLDNHATRIERPKVNYNTVLKMAAAFSDERTSDALSQKMNTYGKIEKGGQVTDEAHALLLRIWKVFPQYQPLLINGLFSGDDDLRLFCLHRLQFCTVECERMAFLCQSLAEEVSDTKIQRELQRASAELAANR